MLPPKPVLIFVRSPGKKRRNFFFNIYFSFFLLIVFPMPHGNIFEEAGTAEMEIHSSLSRRLCRASFYALLVTKRVWYFIMGAKEKALRVRAKAAIAEEEWKLWRSRRRSYPLVSTF